MLRSQHYRYQPRESIVRQHYQQQGTQRSPAPGQRGRQDEAPMRSPRPQDSQRATPPQQGGPAAPHSQQPQRDNENIQRAAPIQTHPQPRGPAVQNQRQQPGLHGVSSRHQGRKASNKDRRIGGSRKRPSRDTGQGRSKKTLFDNQRTASCYLFYQRIEDVSNC